MAEVTKTFGSYSINGDRVSPECLLQADLIAWDTETTGTKITRDRMHGVAVCIDDHHAYWFPVGHPAIPLLTDKLAIAHNAKFDIMMMAKAGTPVSHVPLDTIIAAHMIGRPAHDLKYLSMIDLGLDHVDYTDIGKSFDNFGLDDMAKFSGLHAIHTLLLWKKYERKLKTLGSYDLFMNTEMPLVPILARMEMAGVAVDKDKIAELGKYFEGKQAELVEHLNTLTVRKGINYNSPQQVAPILFEDLKIPVERRTKKEGRPSVDARQLEKYRDKYPFVDVYLQYKAYSTLINSYSDSLLKEIYDGRIYCNFNQTGTETGRLSSSGPNLQKIPKRTEEGKKIRTAFIAPPGFMLVKVDASQLEFRMGGVCSEDPAIISAYLSGRDIHDETARRVFGSSSKRREAKNLNFQMLYGGGKGPEVTKFKQTYVGYQRWVDMIQRFVRSEGYVKTLGGRIRVIGDAQEASGYMYKHMMNEAVNTIVQGSSAEVVKRAMARADKAISGSGAFLVLQVHDEMVYQVPIRALRDVVVALSEALPSKEFIIPITFEFEIGKNWGEMTVIKPEEFR